MLYKFLSSKFIWTIKKIYIQLNNFYKLQILNQFYKIINNNALNTHKSYWIRIIEAFESFVLSWRGIEPIVKHESIQNFVFSNYHDAGWNSRVCWNEEELNYFVLLDLILDCFSLIIRSNVIKFTRCLARNRDELHEVKRHRIDRRLFH